MDTSNMKYLPFNGFCQVLECKVRVLILYARNYLLMV